MSGIFVNYRSDDDDFAAALVDDHLCPVFGGDNVFRDSRSLEAGTEFPPELWRRLLSSDVLLVLIGRRWLSLIDSTGTRCVDRPEDYVRREIEAALDAGLRVIPVLLNGASMPARHELPDSLHPLVVRQYVELRQRHSGVDLAHLVEVLSSSVPPLSQKQPDNGTRAAPARVDFYQGGIWVDGATINGDLVARDKILNGGSA